jgi:hypothetical protein
MQVETGPQVPFSDVPVGSTFVLTAQPAKLLLKGIIGSAEWNVELANGQITNTITPGELCVLSSYKAVPA